MEIKNQERDKFMKTLLEDKVNWTFTKAFKLDDETKRKVLENAYDSEYNFSAYAYEEYKNYYADILDRTVEISCRISNEGYIDLLTFKDAENNAIRRLFVFHAMSLDIFMKTLLKEKVNWTFTKPKFYDEKEKVLLNRVEKEYPQRLLILKNALWQLQSYEYKTYYDEILKRTTEISCRISNNGNILLTFKDDKEDIWSLSVTDTI
jgi:hypothetical protein